MRLMLIVLVLIPLTCLAVPTGLNMMPTAEVLPIGHSRIDYESPGSGKLYVPDGSSLTGTQGGVLPGVEAGVDALSESSAVYNVKWAFYQGNAILPVLAVGVQGVTGGEEPEYYAVASKSILPNGWLALHAGALHDAGDNSLALFGANGKFGILVVKADYVNGGDRDGQSISGGIEWQSFGVLATHYDYQDQPDEDTITFSYFYF